MPEIPTPSAKANVSTSEPPWSSSKLRKLTAPTVPALSAVMSHVLGTSSPTSMSEAALPEKDSIPEVPPVPVAPPVAKLTVTAVE